jgi:hypothetical protein
MSEYKETEVSNVPWLNPEFEIEMTEEPQAQTSLGGHAVPEPGHLVTYSQKGVGEKPGRWQAGGADFEPTPPDAPPVKVVAGGGTVGPDVDHSVATANAVFVAAPTAETSDPSAAPEFTGEQENVEGTSSLLIEPLAAPETPARAAEVEVETEDLYKPADYTVEQVQEFVTANPTAAGEVLAAEESGKERVTLVEWLRDFHEAETFDPSDHSVDDVKEFVNAHPDRADAVLAAESDGKNRTTLVKWLAENKPAGAGAGDNNSPEEN